MDNDLISRSALLEELEYDPAKEPASTTSVQKQKSWHKPAENGSRQRLRSSAKMIEIKCCPRCNADMPRLVYVHGYWTIQCDLCYEAASHKKTPEEAIKIWNENRRNK